MRIGYFARIPYRHNHPSGGFAHMRQFLACAAGQGHDLVLWHGGEHPHPKVRAAPAGRLSRLRELRRCDVLYYRVEYRLPRDSQWMLPPRRMLLTNPLVVWEFNTVPEYARIVGEPQSSVLAHIAALRKYGAACDLAVCVSNAITDYVKTTLGMSRAITVPNGSDPDLFHPDVPPVKHVVRDPARLNVVWIGSADVQWHNFDLLRDAAWQLWDDGEPVVNFHIIGQGMTGLRDLPPNVYYHGAEEYDKLPAWLSAMDVGLNMYKSGPADYSSPLKLFDYMASGLAVVSTDQPQAREVFQQLGQTDLLVPTDNPAALADVLRKLAADRQRGKTQGAAGRKLVIDFYNWQRAARDTLAAIEALSKKARGDVTTASNTMTTAAEPARS